MQTQQSQRRPSSTTLLPEERKILAEHRIPVGPTSPHKTGWIVSIDEESYPIGEREATMIQSYAEYLADRLYPQFREELLKKKIPAVAGNDTVVLRRGSHLHQRNNLWFWRKISWEDNAYMPTGRVEALPTRTLLETLDLMSESSPKLWIKWKNRHPEVFQLH
jgi:hypothetical protein